MHADDVTLEDLAGDPHPHLARLRATSPVARVPAIGGVMVTSRAAAVAVLRDPATFTVDDPRFSTAQVVGPSMLSRDGAEHTRHREPFTSPFRPRLVAERFERFVVDTVRQRVEAIRRSGQAGATELRTALAGPVAAAVVAESLGLDGRDDAVVARLLGWYGDIVSSVSGVSAGCPVTASGAAAMAELGQSLHDHLRGLGAESMLTEAARGGGLTGEEVVSNAAVLMFGGIETTEGMILNVLWHVLGEPGTRLVVDSHPKLAVAAVEESLRLEPAAAVVDRYATRAVHLGGLDIAAGELVVVSLAGANRDPLEFPDPDRFELNRSNIRRHLAFAAGPHVCIGMDLARLEARVALVELLAALPGAELADGAPPPTGLVFRKPARLPLRWS